MQSLKCGLLLAIWCFLCFCWFMCIMCLRRSKILMNIHSICYPCKVLNVFIHFKQTLFVLLWLFSWSNKTKKKTDYFLDNKKWNTSPSWHTYCRPSARIFPSSLILVSDSIYFISSLFQYTITNIVFIRDGFSFDKLIFKICMNTTCCLEDHWEYYSRILEQQYLLDW